MAALAVPAPDRLTPAIAREGALQCPAVALDQSHWPHGPLAGRAWLPSSTDGGPREQRPESGTQGTCPTIPFMFRYGALPAPECTSSIGKVEPSSRPPRGTGGGIRNRSAGALGALPASLTHSLLRRVTKSRGRLRKLFAEVDISMRGLRWSVVGAVGSESRFAADVEGLAP